MSSRLSVDERLKIIELFTSCQSIVVTQRKFITFITKMNAPTRKSIERIVAKFEENGSVTHQHNMERQGDRDPCVTLVITTRLKHLSKRVQD